MAQRQEARRTMDTHDEPFGESPPGDAETEELLRGIPLAAMPPDRDSLFWACGYEAGKATTGRVTPVSGGMIRAWLPLIASTAAGFLIGFTSAGAFSSSRVMRGATPELATAAPDVLKPSVDNPLRSTPAAVRVETPHDGLSASLPPARLETLLAAPSTPPELRGTALPPDRPPLRIRNGFMDLDRIDL